MFALCRDCWDLSSVEERVRLHVISHGAHRDWEEIAAAVERASGEPPADQVEWAERSVEQNPGMEWAWDGLSVVVRLRQQR